MGIRYITEGCEKMKKIFKYRLEPADVQRLYILKGSKILSVEEQYGKVVLYALVDDTYGELDCFKIFVKRTGHLADDVSDCKFLGTVKLDEGRLMFHVFYRQVTR